MGQTALFTEGRPEVSIPFPRACQIQVVFLTPSVAYIAASSLVFPLHAFVTTVHSYILGFLCSCTGGSIFDTQHLFAFAAACFAVFHRQIGSNIS